MSAAEQLDPALWQTFRSAMSVTAKWAYFDHAAVAPLPVAAPGGDRNLGPPGRRRGRHRLARVEPPRRRSAHLGRPAAGRRCFGDRPGAQHDRGNRPRGRRLSLAGGRQRRHAGQRVSLEPISLDEPRRARRRNAARVEAEGGRVDLAQLEAACDSRTRIITVSWVGYLSGWRLELDEVVEIARRVGALVFVDAIQGLGVFPLDVRATPIDFLAADGHKWLLGPEGRGAVLHPPRASRSLAAVGVGWHSVAHASDYAASS